MNFLDMRVLVDPESSRNDIGKLAMGVEFVVDCIIESVPVMLNSGFVDEVTPSLSTLAEWKGFPMLVVVLLQFGWGNLYIDVQVIRI